MIGSPLLGVTLSGPAGRGTGPGVDGDDLQVGRRDAGVRPHAYRHAVGTAGPQRPGARAGIGLLVRCRTFGLLVGQPLPVAPAVGLAQTYLHHHAGGGGSGLPGHADQPERPDPGGRQLGGGAGAAGGRVGDRHGEAVDGQPALGTGQRRRASRRAGRAVAVRGGALVGGRGRPGQQGEAETDHHPDRYRKTSCTRERTTMHFPDRHLFEPRPRTSVAGGSVVTEGAIMDTPCPCLPRAVANSP